MLELGKRQTLKIVKRTDFGVYLAEEGDRRGTCASSREGSTGACSDR